MGKRPPASMRAREAHSALIEGRRASPAGRSELIELARRLIVEEALESEVRDALDRDCDERGVARARTIATPSAPASEDGGGWAGVLGPAGHRPGATVPLRVARASEGSHRGARVPGGGDAGLPLGLGHGSCSSGGDRGRSQPRPEAWGAGSDHPGIGRAADRRRSCQARAGRPPGEATHWTGRAMARAVGISLRSVQRIWQAHRLQPHRLRTFKRSTDPDFAAKLADVVGLYVDPPKHAIVSRSTRSPRSRRSTEPSRACR